jgi:23S rRNA (guanine745-N1)-methyltransferase
MTAGMPAAGAGLPLCWRQLAAWRLKGLYSLAFAPRTALHSRFTRRIPMPLFTCPLCHTALVPEPRVWRCAQGHCFDVARDGHVNLLPVQFRHSKAPGDPLLMVQARRAFLAAGHYAPLREALAEAVSDACKGRAAPVCLLDIGCGEGYYTSAFAGEGRDVVGVDIAKPAIEAAARRLRQMTWLVARGTHLPCAPHSVDVITSIFAPLPVDELRRVCRPGGCIVVAMAGAGHLAGLREGLFDEVREHDPDHALAPLRAAFTEVCVRDVSFDLELATPDIGFLLDMTPYAWRAKPERVAAMRAKEQLSVAAVLRLAVFRHDAPVQDVSPVTG